MGLSPVLLFTYNRLEHTIKTVEALKKNFLANESDLFIFSDGYKDNETKLQVDNIRSYLQEIDGFKSITIIERDRNLGLANSIITGVTEIINKYNKVIVLEDDIITSQNFLDYMNQALVFYEDDKKCFSISAYLYPSKKINYRYDGFYYPRNASWGWATWKNRWEKVKWDITEEEFYNFYNNKSKVKIFSLGGEDMPNMLKLQIIDKKINSWAIRFDYSRFLNNAYSILPIVSKTNNIGWDGTGTHCGNTNQWDVNIDNTNKRKFNFTKVISLTNRLIIFNVNKTFKNKKNNDFFIKFYNLFKKFIKNILFVGKWYKK